MTDGSNSTSLSIRPENDTSVVWFHGMEYKSFDVNKMALSPMDKKIMLAHKGYTSKIKNMEAQDSGMELSAAINTAIFDSGINMDPDDRDLVIQRTIKDIYADHGGLTVREVELAFHLGVRNRLVKQYFGINPATLSIFLDEFIHTRRATAITNFMRCLPVIKDREATPEDKARIHQEWLMKKINSYQNTVKSRGGSVIGSNTDCDMYYHFLHMLSIVKPSKSKKKKIFKEAIDKVTEELKNNPELFRNSRTFMSGIQQATHRTAHTFNTRVNSLSREAVLIDKLTAMAEKKVDLYKKIQRAVKKTDWTLDKFYAYLNEQQFKNKRESETEETRTQDGE